ncbi:helix-turn-helix domain-containing protein [Nocardia brasiliensis]|uniref:helix-turn-helix domain-containing protein n=1 Tax=Nocardia brasiliensis TaxID=37326 RepID=UPI002456B10D|nr:helix-turn-helix transcriptional regulator [Nocardia brasiliensis]
MATASPTVAGWELMLRIRERADARGMKANRVASELDVSAQYWSQLVRGKGVLGQDKLAILMNLLEFDEGEQDELKALREIAKERAPYAEFSALLNDNLMRFYGLELGARAIRSFENGVIPGLLQTEDYARVLMKSRVTTGRPTEVEQRVKVRIRRQQRLNDPDEPFELSVVIGEAALKYQVGGPEVQGQQLRHLVELAQKLEHKLDVRVIPFEAGGSIASLNAATFHLLTFESARLPPLGWVETAIYGEVADDPKRVSALEYLYEQVQAIALPQDESLRLIEQSAIQLG